MVITSRTVGLQRFTVELSKAGRSGSVMLKNHPALRTPNHQRGINIGNAAIIANATHQFPSRGGVAGEA
jgi:hypothetical protein